MLTASVYGWLVRQELWPSALGGLLYWGIPLSVGFLAGRKGVRRAWHDIKRLVAEHNATEARKADHLESISARLDTISQQQQPARDDER